MMNGRRDGEGSETASGPVRYSMTDDDEVANGLDDPDEVDPQTCALLVLGCQPGVLEGIPNSDALIERINGAIDIVRRRGGYVGFIRLAFTNFDYQFIPSTNKEFALMAQERRLQHGTLEADIHSTFDVQAEDLIVTATRLGAFSTTDLDEQLTNLGITTLIVAGVDTTGMVLSAVRDAADRDYRQIVLSDCTADPDVNAHDLVVSRILPRQAEVITVAGLCLRLDEGVIGSTAAEHAVS